MFIEPRSLEISVAPFRGEISHRWISLLTELGIFCSHEFYKHLAPNGAKTTDRSCYRIETNVALKSESVCPTARSSSASMSPAIALSFLKSNNA